MLQAINQILQVQVEPRDFIAFAAVLVSVVAFVTKLSSDTRIARYRETVTYIEKKEAETRARWQAFLNGDLTDSEREEALRVHLGQMELVSFLMRENVFEPALVYEYWWRYFDEPLRNPAVNSWVQMNRLNDSALLVHYLRRCELWADRLDREQGRPARPFYKRLATRLGF